MQFEHDFDSLYVSLPVELEGLPQTIQALGQTWERQEDLHITLFAAERIAPAVIEHLHGDQSEAFRRLEASSQLFKGLRAPTLGPQLRIATREERQTLLAMAALTGVDSLYSQVSEITGIDVPVPPTHVALYKLPGQKTVGLASFAQLRALSRTLTATELKEVRGQGVKPALIS